MEYNIFIRHKLQNTDKQKTLLTSFPRTITLMIVTNMEKRRQFWHRKTQIILSENFSKARTVNSTEENISVAKKQ